MKCHKFTQSSRSSNLKHRPYTPNWFRTMHPQLTRRSWKSRWTCRLTMSQVRTRRVPLVSSKWIGGAHMGGAARRLLQIIRWSRSIYSRITPKAFSRTKTWVILISEKTISNQTLQIKATKPWGPSNARHRRTWPVSSLSEESTLYWTSLWQNLLKRRWKVPTKTKQIELA